MEPILEMIKTLTGINSPSGDTEEAVQLVEKYAKDLGYQATLTNKGALLIIMPDKDDEVQHYITAHVNILGAMVKGVKGDGRLAVELIGGFAYNAIESEYCQTKINTGQICTGTICLHETDVHVYRNSHEIPRDQKHMEVRIDRVTTSEEDTKGLGISVGNFINFDPRTVITSSGFIKSRHLDDKANVAMILQLLEKLEEEQIILSHATQLYVSSNEEISYGTSTSVDSEIKECTALDMGALGDSRASDEYIVSICAKDASGPCHKQSESHLVNLCRINNIPYKVGIYSYYGSDASAALHVGADIRHGLFGAGIESSHAMERTHIDPIKATEKLLYAYYLSPIE